MEVLGVSVVITLIAAWVAVRVSKREAYQIGITLTDLLSKLESRKDQEIKRLDAAVARACSDAEAARNQVKALVNLDVGIHHDCGWLVLITKVGGQDRVMLQELKPEMTWKEYNDLVERLGHDCGAVLRYADAPYGWGEAFLAERNTRVRRSGR